MKKLYLSLFVLFLVVFSQAQENIFLGRDYWKTQPTIEDVKMRIKEGNDPVEKSRFAFDAVSYAIISHAPTDVIKYLLTIPGNEVNKITHDTRNYLLWAAYAGNIELVNHLLDKGSDIKWIDDKGFDIVTFTAVGGHTKPDLYEIYKKHGFVLKNSVRRGADALFIAAPAAKDIKDLDYFIKEGMSLNTIDDNGNNLFLNVASKGNVKLMKQLIDKGIDYKKINNDNANAILIAAMGARRHTNKKETFDYLLNLDINPLIKNNLGRSALHYLAYSNPDWDIFKMFIDKGLNTNDVDKNGNTPFMNAVYRKNHKAADHLMALDKNINHSNKKGFSALSYSVANQDLDYFNKLIEAGAKTNIITANNESLINLLFENYSKKNQKNFKEILNVLQKYDVKPTVNKEDNDNLFHIIANKNFIELADTAKQLGVDINQLNIENLSPLHMAAMKAKDLKMLKKLVSLGADRRQVTEFGEDAMVLALENELLKATPKELSFLAE